MKIVFDTNVVLDVLLDRRPHSAVASKLLVHVEQKRIEGLLGATTVTTLYYLAAKAVGRVRAVRHIRVLLSLFEVARVDRGVLSDALQLSFGDYEDAVIHEAARHAGAVGIVTRDEAGFRGGRLSVYRPDELLSMLEALPPSGQAG